MKFAVRSMTFLLALLAGVFARAQSPVAAPTPIFPSNIKHVVVIFQENRTPDNLFQGLFDLYGKDLSGNPVKYDIQQSYMDAHGQPQLLQPVGLATNFDLDHSHRAFVIESDGKQTLLPPICGPNVYGCAPSIPTVNSALPTWSQFMFVENTPVKNGNGSTVGLLDPYLNLAKDYGWANRMFQTNQGPSYPAHQFIFAGTSARTRTEDQAAIFVAENPSSFGNTGCPAPLSETYCVIYPPGKFPDPAPTPCYSPKNNPLGVNPKNEAQCQVGGIYKSGDPCYSPSGPALCFTQKERQDMGYLLDHATPPIDWKYYAPSSGTICTAPNSVQEICQPGETDRECNDDPYGPWGSHVVLETQTDRARILRDIAGCHLAPVSWVIPDGMWSDHAVANNGLGPAWVAAIVNSIGTKPQCPTGTPNAGETLWNDTAIVITWDDWGGWFDHVKPPILPCTSTSDCQGDYQYGFRVPMIVVSAYTPQSYVNNSIHDFGSILRMIEGVFSLGQGKLGFADARATTDLREFFALKAPRSFTPIPSIKDAKFFLEQTGPPAAPDND